MEYKEYTDEEKERISQDLFLTFDSLISEWDFFYDYYEDYDRFTSCCFTAFQVFENMLLNIEDEIEDIDFEVDDNGRIYTYKIILNTSDYDDYESISLESGWAEIENNGDGYIISDFEADASYIIMPLKF